jgi:UDP-N-acetylglucosamine 2-epimerase
VGTRQSDRERAANVIDVDYDSDQIVSAIRYHLNVGRYASDHLYGDGRAGERIAEILGRIKRSDIPIQKSLHFPQLELSKAEISKAVVKAA